MEAFRKTRAIVNLDHLIENAKSLRKLIPNGSFYCPMVKADAYGHGALQVVTALSKNNFEPVGVSLLEEAIQLRDFGFKQDILVFGAITSGFNELLNYHLTPVVSDYSHLQLLDQTVSSSIDLHIKFDTGMSRLGFAPADVESVLEYFTKNKKFKVQGLLSHLLSGDDVTATQEQVSRLVKVAKKFESFRPQVHLWNSSGLLLKTNHPEIFPEATNWGGRPGIGLYGGAQQKPVMSFRSVIVQAHKIPKGQTVSYDGTWRAERESLIGTVTCGYADGYHRQLSNKGRVLILGESVPIAGLICMDYFMVDLTDLEKKYPGRDFRNQEVTLFGSDENGKILEVAEIAGLASTNSYELLTSVSRRVPRVYQGAT